MRTFGANAADSVVTAASASLDAMAAGSFSVMFEGFVSTITANRIFVFHGDAGVDGWVIRLRAAGDVEVRYSRATTHQEYFTSDTPFSDTATWKHVLVTFDGTRFRFYHDKATPGTLVESTYGTETVGSGAFSAPGSGLHIGNNQIPNAVLQGSIGRIAFFSSVKTTTEAEAWFAQPRGDAADCVAFYCMGSSSPEYDWSGTTSLNRNPGTVTGATVGDGSAAGAAGYVHRTVGATARQLAHPTDILALITGKDIRATTGNLRLEFEQYDDAVFDFTAEFELDGYTADPYIPETDDATKCCIIVGVAAGEKFVFPSQASGVRWRRTTAPAVSEYICGVEQPGLGLRDIMVLYTGGTVSSDTIQIRAMRVNFACIGYSHLERCWVPELNSGRAGATVVGISVPGGMAYDCVVGPCGAGQLPDSTRNFSSGPNTLSGRAGLVNCSSYGGGGKGFQVTANGAAITVICRNCIDVGSVIGFWIEDEGFHTGSIDAGNNISSDATADDFGGTGNQINVVAADQYVDPGTGDLRLQDGSDARGAGTLLAYAPNIDIADYDYSADATPDVGAWQNTSPISSGSLLLLFNTRTGKDVS